MKQITYRDIVEEFNAAQPTKAWLEYHEAGPVITCRDRFKKEIVHHILIPISNEGRVGVARALAQFAGWSHEHMQAFKP